MLIIGTFLLNLIMFGMEKMGSKVDAVVVIIICSVVVGIIGIPLLIFFVFHLCLIISGKTTREMIKSVKEEKQENQWCHVDPPLINYFMEVSEEEISLIRN